MYDYFAQDDHTAWLHQMTERIMRELLDAEKQIAPLMDREA